MSRVGPMEPRVRNSYFDVYKHLSTTSTAHFCFQRHWVIW